jgi:hypothetical protein
MTITSSIKLISLIIAIIGQSPILNWWSGWVVLLVIAPMIKVTKKGKII